MKPGHITANVEGNALRMRRALIAPLALSVASSCNIVQGFQDAGDALFPPQKTYVETPGFRLAEGDFRRLNVGVGDELYLLARSSSDTDPSLFSMRYVDPAPCQLSNVVRYWSSGLPTDYPAQILYFESDVRRGTLHFADARCNVHDLVLEDAEFPMDESSRGLLLISGMRLLFVDPPVGDVQVVRDGVQAVFPSGPGGHVLLVDGKLESYTQNWDRIGDAVGDGVVSVRGVGGVFLFEDSMGIHALGAFSGTEGPSIFVTDVDLDGCRLGWVSGSKIAYYSPCAEGRLAVWDASTSVSTGLEYVADPAFFALELDPKADASRGPFPDGYWFYSLRDFTPEGATLVARSPDGDELVLGTNAKLERTNLDTSGDYGLAVIDASGEVGRLVRWERDGTVTTVAENMLTSSGDLIVNWNGAAGDRAKLSSEGELEITLTGVPRRDFDYKDAKNRWRAVFDDSRDGISGTLSIASPSGDYAGKHAIAYNVRHPRHEFLDVVLPGIAYVSNYDPATDTGTLEYNNLELGFRGTVSEGVSDFIPTGNGILYSVPFGRAKGVWLARAE